MQDYYQLLREILDEGAPSTDRTGTGTRRTFGRMLRFDLQEGFPLLTTRRMWMRGIAEELFWFLSGSTNIRPLLQAGVSIWTDWPLQQYIEAIGADVPMEGDRYRTETDAYQDLKSRFETAVRTDEDFARNWGDIGPVYGKKWRDFEGRERRVDQIRRLIEGIQKRPRSRRHLVSAWDPTDHGIAGLSQSSEVALSPCHYAFQCFVEGEPGNGGTLSLMWQQRSLDLFIGAPWNVASYALLTHLLAEQTSLQPGMLLLNAGDCHLYDNHRQQARTLLDRTPRPSPTLHLSSRQSLFDYEFGDIFVEDYDAHPKIDAPIAV